MTVSNGSIISEKFLDGMLHVGDGHPRLVGGFQGVGSQPGPLSLMDSRVKHENDGTGV